MQQTQFLFIYGSLLSGFKSPAYEYISKYFSLLGAATVNGTMYDMGAYPVVTAANTGRVIKGELYQIRNQPEFSYVMAQLDDYEGLHPDEENEKVDYERSLTDAVLSDGSIHQAWVYWYKHGVDNLPVVESGDVFEYMASH